MSREPPLVDPHSEANRAWWDAVVPIHEASRGYDRDGFLRGEKPLCPVELAEFGPRVNGQHRLRLEFVHEHRAVPWSALPTMQPVGPVLAGADGRYQAHRMWQLPEAQRDLVPLMYSVLATKG